MADGQQSQLRVLNHNSAPDVIEIADTIRSISVRLSTLRPNQRISSVRRWDTSADRTPYPPMVGPRPSPPSTIGLSLRRPASPMHTGAPGWLRRLGQVAARRLHGAFDQAPHLLRCRAELDAFAGSARCGRQLLGRRAHDRSGRHLWNVPACDTALRDNVVPHPRRYRPPSAGAVSTLPQRPAACSRGRVGRRRRARAAMARARGHHPGRVRGQARRTATSRPSRGPARHTGRSQAPDRRPEPTRRRRQQHVGWLESADGRTSPPSSSAAPQALSVRHRQRRVNAASDKPTDHGAPRTTYR